MLDIVKMSEDLHSKLQQDMDSRISDRLMTKDVLEARTRELAVKREDELRRIDAWAAQQKAMVAEVFAALISETEIDRRRNEETLRRIKGEEAVKPRLVAAPIRHLRAAAE